MEKVEIPPRGKYANRFNLRTLELGEYYDVLDELYSTDWARTVGTTLRYYENDSKKDLKDGEFAKKFVQRKWPHPTKDGKFIIRIYRSE